MTSKHRIIFSWLGSFAVLVLAVYAVIAGKTQMVDAAPAVFTVTNTNDAGAGSLRQAVTDANTNGNPADQDVIQFNIPVTGDARIELLSPLTISQSVLVDGYTQGDAEANTIDFPNPMNGLLRVEIDQAGSGAINVSGNNVTLQGLAMSNTSDNTLTVDHADNFKLYGSYIDIRIGSGMPQTNDTKTGGVRILGSDNATLGGTQAARRNVFGSCVSSCIYAAEDSGADSNNLTVQGNNIGIGFDNLTDLGPVRGGKGGVGVMLSEGANNAVIGGEAATAGNSFERINLGAIQAQDVDGLSILGNRMIFNTNFKNFQGTIADEIIGLGGVTNAQIGSVTAGNVVAGNRGDNAMAVGDSDETDVASSNILIEGNTIGFIDDGTTVFGNDGPGIHIRDNAHTIAIRGNTIHNSYGSGIRIFDNAQDVSVTGNSIYNNQQAGIDIGPMNSHTDNDTGDIDSGPNGVLNHPSNVLVNEVDGDTVVGYKLDVPNGSYRVEFFSTTTVDPSGFGEGETYVGFQNVTKSGSGQQEYSQTLPGTDYETIITTVTEVDNTSPFGFGATSEFSSNNGAAVLEADLASSMHLLNPEDVAVGATLDYEVTIENKGPNTVDLSAFDNSLLGTNSLFYLFSPDELNVQSITGAGVSCVPLGEGSAISFGPAMAEHADHEAVLCGVSGATILDPGEKIVFTMQVEVDASTDFDWAIYTLVIGIPEDPENSIFTQASQSGQDIINLFLSSGVDINNLSVSYYPEQDLAIAKDLTNPDEITAGGEAKYAITFTNEGDNDIDLSAFDASTVPNPLDSALFWDVLPEDMVFTSVETADVNCIWAGPGSASMVPFLVDRPTSGLMYCGYSGDTVLAPGDTFVVNLTATINEDSDLVFTNYALTATITDNFGGDLLGHDPDMLRLMRTLYTGVGSSPDGISRLEGSGFNNIAVSSFGEDEPDPDPDPDPSSNNGGSSGGADTDDDLANTGQNISKLALFAVVVGLSLVAGSLGVKGSKHEEKTH